MSQEHPPSCRCWNCDIESSGLVKELRAENARLTAENRALTDEYHSIREAAREGLSEEQNRAHARTIEKIQFVREQRDTLKIECEGLKSGKERLRNVLVGIDIMLDQHQRGIIPVLDCTAIREDIREQLDTAHKGGK